MVDTRANIHFGSHGDHFFHPKLVSRGITSCHGTTQSTSSVGTLVIGPTDPSGEEVALALPHSNHMHSVGGGSKDLLSTSQLTDVSTSDVEIGAGKHSGVLFDGHSCKLTRRKGICYLRCRLERPRVAHVASARLACLVARTPGALQARHDR